MPGTSLQLIAAALTLVLLSFAVGLLMLYTRMREIERKRVHPQAISTSAKMATQLECCQASDNFRDLFETPVLFYALVATALAVGYVPAWLAWCAWLYVVFRFAHSIIHCTYNKVFHRLTAFLASFGLLVGMWVAYVIGLAAMSGQ